MCFDLRSFSKMKDLFLLFFYIFREGKIKTLSGYGVNGSMRDLGSCGLCSNQSNQK